MEQLIFNSLLGAMGAATNYAVDPVCDEPITELPGTKVRNRSSGQMTE
jgi:hypothetical protein